MARASLITAMLLSGCSSTSFVSTWKAPDAKPLELKGAKVAAVVMMQNEASRRAAEDALARELTDRGAQGVPLYSLLPDAPRDDEAAVRAALEKAGVAGAVVMRPMGVDKEFVSTPTYSSAHYGGLWGGYYRHGWDTAWVSGYEVRTDTIVSVETLVYSLAQNKLVWAGQSRTTNPDRVEELIREISSATAEKLEEEGLIPD